MRTLSVLVVACLGVTAVAAPVPKGKAKTLEEKLIGTWKLVPEQEKNLGYALYVEYKAGGVMEIRFEYDGNLLPKETYTGSWKAVEPDDTNKLGTIDWTAKYDTEVKAEVAKIDKLTDDELTEVDPDGIVERFVRVKAEKRDK